VERAQFTVLSLHKNNKYLKARAIPQSPRLI
jgi:hypothetical protein